MLLRSLRRGQNARDRPYTTVESPTARYGAVRRIRFTRPEAAFSAQDRERAALLAKRLGLPVDLAD